MIAAIMHREGPSQSAGCGDPQTIGATSATRWARDPIPVRSTVSVVGGCVTRSLRRWNQAAVGTPNADDAANPETGSALGGNMTKMLILYSPNPCLEPRE